MLTNNFETYCKLYVKSSVATFVANLFSAILHTQRIGQAPPTGSFGGIAYINLALRIATTSTNLSRGMEAYGTTVSSRKKCDRETHEGAHSLS
jgi:hypothetical protein